MRYTVYNTIPARGSTNALYGFRTVIDRCSRQTGYKQKSAGSGLSLANATTVFIKDYARYLPPHWETGGYYALAAEMRQGRFTLAPGDFIVFGEVQDECKNKTSQEFNEIKKKYAGFGMSVSLATPYLDMGPICGIDTRHLEAVSL